jgi:hypothetical protein
MRGCFQQTPFILPIRCSYNKTLSLGFVRNVRLWRRAGVHDMAPPVTSISGFFSSWPGRVAVAVGKNVSGDGAHPLHYGGTSQLLLLCGGVHPLQYGGIPQLFLLTIESTLCIMVVDWYCVWNVESRALELASTLLAFRVHPLLSCWYDRHFTLVQAGTIMALWIRHPSPSSALMLVQSPFVDSWFNVCLALWSTDQV